LISFAKILHFFQQGFLGSISYGLPLLFDGIITYIAVIIGFVFLQESPAWLREQESLSADAGPKDNTKTSSINKRESAFGFDDNLNDDIQKFEQDCGNPGSPALLPVPRAAEVDSKVSDSIGGENKVADNKVYDNKVLNTIMAKPPVSTTSLVKRPLPPIAPHLVIGSGEIKPSVKRLSTLPLSVHNVKNSQHADTKTMPLLPQTESKDVLELPGIKSGSSVADDTATPLCVLLLMVEGFCAGFSQNGMMAMCSLYFAQAYRLGPDQVSLHLLPIAIIIFVNNKFLVPLVQQKIGMFPTQAYGALIGVISHFFIVFLPLSVNIFAFYLHTMSSGTRNSTLPAIVGGYTSQKTRARIFSWMQVCQAVGRVASPALCGRLAVENIYVYPFALMSFVNLIGFLFVVWAWRSAPVDTESVEKEIKKRLIEDEIQDVEKRAESVMFMGSPACARRNHPDENLSMEECIMKCTSIDFQSPKVQLLQRCNPDFSFAHSGNSSIVSSINLSRQISQPNSYVLNAAETITRPTSEQHSDNNISANKSYIKQAYNRTTTSHASTPANAALPNISKESSSKTIENENVDYGGITSAHVPSIGRSGFNSQIEGSKSHNILSSTLVPDTGGCAVQKERHSFDVTTNYQAMKDNEGQDNQHGRRSMEGGLVRWLARALSSGFESVESFINSDDSTSSPAITSEFVNGRRSKKPATIQQVANAISADVSNPMLKSHAEIAKHIS
jgi:hypothetical protein